MSASVRVIVLSIAAMGCGACSGETNAAGSDQPETVRARETGAPPIVRGHVLDRATREAVVGARIEGPGGQTAVSDAEGFFEIRGFEPGEAGPLVGRVDDGREGRVTLRPLESGTLEVVLHLGD